MDTQVEEGKPTYSVIEFTFSDQDTDTEFIVLCNGKRLLIHLSADNFSESPSLKSQYLFFLRVAEEFKLEGHTVDDFYDWVLEPFLPLLHNIPPLGLDARPNLHDFFFPETVVYTSDVALDQLIPRPYEALETDTGQMSYGVLLKDEICSAWTSFLPSEMEIIPKQPGNALSATPRKVKLVGDTVPFFFKPARSGDQSTMEREIQTYMKIKDAGLDDELRISRLHGLVQDEDGLVFGLLLTYIDCGNKTLACAGSEAPPALRRRWAYQVRATVKRLYGAGVIWADVKADNVLVDGDDDAWVIDFGDGYTEGCVEKESAGTVEGDLLGIENLFDFLGV